ncbi:MAG: hypothetical protein R3D25_11305 [Geminicoccaceae bacterium]
MRRSASPGGWLGEQGLEGGPVVALQRLVEHVLVGTRRRFGLGHRPSCGTAWLARSVEKSRPLATGGRGAGDGLDFAVGGSTIRRPAAAPPWGVPDMAPGQLRRSRGVKAAA